jgi:hypothetical protein
MLAVIGAQGIVRKIFDIEKSTGVLGVKCFFEGKTLQDSGSMISH